jgi:type IV secretory pathway VirB4 component
LLLGTVARGGRVVTLDRTAAGEYAVLTGAVAGKAVVVGLDADAEVGLDPLRVFPGEEGVRVALGFLTLLTRTTPSDVDGAVLASAVRAVATAGGGSCDVLVELERAADPEAHGLRRKLAAYADHPLARLVFGTAPPLRLDADYICFHAPGLSLPDRDAMVHEHLARQLLPEQIFAQALLYLVAAVCKALTFDDRTRFGATLMDEAWALTASPQGRQLLLDSIRDGRKHNAAVWLLSQHPDDLGDDALSHLLGMRALFRQSRGAAPAALASIGLEPTDDLVELVSAQLQTGQCLLRDVADRVGTVQVLPAASDAVRHALDTTPAAAA